MKDKLLNYCEQTLLDRKLKKRSIAIRDLRIKLNGPETYEMKN